jgi:hypothetical protein
MHGTPLPAIAAEDVEYGCLMFFRIAAFEVGIMILKIVVFAREKSTSDD